MPSPQPLLGADRAFLFLWVERESGGRFKLYAGRDAKCQDVAIATTYSRSVLDEVRLTRKAQVIAGGDQEQSTGVESITAFGLRSMMVAPLLIRDRFIGAVYLDNRLMHGLFNYDDVQILQALANHIAIALETTRSAHELRQARDEALEASRVKSAFLATMSHELRTPLNAIIGYSEMLLEQLEEQLEPSAVKDILRIRSSGYRLFRLITDVLELSRLETGRSSLKIESFEIKPLVYEIASSLYRSMRERGNNLAIQMIDPVSMLDGDRERIRQVLEHLLQNALRSTKNGTIELEVACLNGFAEFEVSYRGIGLSNKMLKQILGSSFQTQANKPLSHGRVGLSLSICQRLCRMMGGRLEAYTRVGVGSTFKVFLPLRGTVELDDAG